ncbi:hypothetical protein A6R68_17549 [Neotoma lepida]|uniref:Uncharacterized protein n=1 Tax=Neotoma lepida TaxID=56216 RepID=A0A1A6HCK2_NEOLE|nr:hypothetical protein A6R68_17549 [Neotoma lepida]
MDQMCRQALERPPANVLDTRFRQEPAGPLQSEGPSEKLGATAPVRTYNIEYERKKKEDGKQAWADKQHVLDMLFLASEKHQYYNQTTQPNTPRNSLTLLRTRKPKGTAVEAFKGQLNQDKEPMR